MENVVVNGQKAQQYQKRSKLLTMRIGYVAQILPYLSETFVYREVFALRAQGLDIKTFATWKPKINTLSEEAKYLVDDTVYIFPLNWAQFLLRHIGYLLTRPGRYLSTFWFCLTSKHASFYSRQRTLLHFLQAVYLAKKVEQQNIQHLHVHFALNATTIALVISRLVGITFSFTAHANDLFVNPILLPQKIKAARFIIPISDFNKQFIYNIVPTPETKNKSHVVHCGIDVNSFTPDVQKPNKDCLTVLAVGRLVEKKGFPYLIKACRILVDQGYRFKCVIIGGGPQEEYLNQMVKEYNLANTVDLVGVVFQEQMKFYLQNADIAVLPCVVGSNQDMDGIPNTLMEAMAMEIPAISTNISGIPELIEDMKTGLLVPSKDDAALAKAMATLFDDENLRVTLGKAGRVKVVNEFEINKNVAALLDILRLYLTD